MRDCRRKAWHGRRPDQHCIHRCVQVRMRRRPSSATRPDSCAWSRGRRVPGPGGRNGYRCRGKPEHGGRGGWCYGARKEVRRASQEEVSLYQCGAKNIDRLEDVRLALHASASIIPWGESVSRSSTRDGCWEAVYGCRASVCTIDALDDSASPARDRFGSLCASFSWDARQSCCRALCRAARFEMAGGGIQRASGLVRRVLLSSQR